MLINKTERSTEISEAVKSFVVSKRSEVLQQNSDSQLAEGESLTDFKMKTLGTREDVRNSFQQYRNLTKGEKRTSSDIN